VIPRICVLAIAAFAVVLGALAPTAEARKLGSRTLDVGDRGSDVKSLQRLLGKAGFRTRPDGVFGSGTARTQRLFERELELRVDGRATPKDVRSLRSAVTNGGTGGYRAGSLDADEAAGADAEERDQPARTTPGPKAVLTDEGLAIAPEGAPEAVKRVIAAANEIARTPYRYGGGHGSWKDTGYDCSGSVSYALHGGDLLDSPMPSGSFTAWGESGAGEWITIYANGGHMYMVVAGLRFDTSGRAQTGSRWQKASRSPSGFTVRHPKGL